MFIGHINADERLVNLLTKTFPELTAGGDR